MTNLESFLQNGGQVKFCRPKKAKNSGIFTSLENGKIAPVKKDPSKYPRHFSMRRDFVVDPKRE